MSKSKRMDGRTASQTRPPIADWALNHKREFTAMMNQLFYGFGREDLVITGKEILRWAKKLSNEYKSYGELAEALRKVKSDPKVDEMIKRLQEIRLRLERLTYAIKMLNRRKQ